MANTSTAAIASALVDVAFVYEAAALGGAVLVVLTAAALHLARDGLGFNEVLYEEQDFQRYQSTEGQPTVFSGAYTITVLQNAYTWLILQFLRAFWTDWHLRKLS